VLEGRRATCYPGVAQELIDNGVLYEDAEVVVDGKLVTARKPADLPAFTREMLRSVGK
jgi:protease I